MTLTHTLAKARRLAVPLIATLGLLLAAASAPPASAATNFAYAIAFQSVSNQHLWYYDGATNPAHDTGLGMAFGSSATVTTSPAMVFDDAGFYVIAFQANTLHAAGNGRLFIYFRKATAIPTPASL